jgi:hypothetical protein
MPLSTSHFSNGVPGKAVRLLGVAVATWAVGALYTVRANPELVFFRRCATVKQLWAQKLDLEFTNKVVFCGGSSCTTSVDGERMLSQHRLPALNMGLGAGMGAEVLTHYAQTSVRTGDTLVVALEPDLLAGPLRIESLGAQFGLSIGEPSLLRDPHRVDWLSALLDLRPGGYHTFTLVTKVLLRRPLFSYFTSEIHPSGWHEVGSRRTVKSLKEAPKLSKEGRSWLVGLREWCDQRKVRVAYALPWGYCSPQDLKRFQGSNLRFLYEVAATMPVLKDPQLGTDTNLEHFADTPFHPTAQGAALRTDELAREIRPWATWTRDELAERLKAIPSDPSQSPL